MKIYEEISECWACDGDGKIEFLDADGKKMEPRECRHCKGTGKDVNNISITIWDEFAKAALIGLLSDNSPLPQNGHYNCSVFELFSALSYDYADAMMAERKKRLSDD